MFSQSWPFTANKVTEIALRSVAVFSLTAGTTVILAEYLCRSETTLTRSNFYPPSHSSGPNHYISVLPARTVTTGHCHIHFSSLLWAFSFWSPLNQSNTNVNSYHISHRDKCPLLICGGLPLGLLINVSSLSVMYPPFLLIMLKRCKEEHTVII